MKVTVDLRDSIAKAILHYAYNEGMTFEGMVSKMLDEKIEQYDRIGRHAEDRSHIRKTHQELITIMLERVEKLEPGVIFVVKDLLTEEWRDIISPRGFGFAARNGLLESGLVQRATGGGGSSKYVRI